MRSLILLAALAACDAGGSRARPAPGEASSTLKLAPPAVVRAPERVPPRAAPTFADEPAAITASALVLPLPAFEAPRNRPNLYADEALERISRGYPGEELYAVRDAAFGVVADPGSGKARFAEACALAQANEHELAKMVVQQLAEQKSCPTCRDALAQVAAGECRFDDATRKLVEGIGPSPRWKAARAIIASLVDGDVSGLATYLDDGVIVRTNACSVCDEEVVSRTKMTAAELTAHAAAAEDRIAHGEGIYVGPGFLFCEGACCSGTPGMLTHSTSQILSVCFRGSANEPKLASLSIIDG